MGEQIRIPKISPETRSRIQRQLIQGTRFGRKVDDPDVKRAMLHRLSVSRIEEIRRRVMEKKRGNLITDTANTVQSWWAGLEVGMAKVGITIYDWKRMQTREAMWAYQALTKGDERKSREEFKQYFNDEIWSAEPTVLQDVVEGWEDTRQRAEMRMMGDTGWVRWLYKGTLDLGLAVGEFAAMGTTRHGAMGIQSLLAMHANEKGRDVYDATGSKTQAFTAAGLNFIVSNLIFARAHKPIAKIRQEADKAILGFDMTQTVKLNKLIEAGRIKAATHTAGEILGVTATAALLRTSEWGMNSMLQEYTGGKQYDGFENTWENFYATIQSGLFEGLTIALIPAAAKAVGGVAGFKRDIALKDLYIEFEQMGKATDSLKNVTGRVSELMGKEDLQGLEDFALQIREYNAEIQNVILDHVADIIELQVKAKRSGKEEVTHLTKNVGESLAKMETGERAEVYREFRRVIAEIVGEAPVGRDAVSKLPPEEAAKIREKQKHETTEEKLDRLYLESLEKALESEKSATEKKIKDSLPKETLERMEKAEKFRVTKQMVAVDLVELNAKMVLEALRAEKAEIEAAPKTPESQRRGEYVSDLIREMESKVQHLERTTGKLEADVEIKLEVEGVVEAELTKEQGAKKSLVEDPKNASPEALLANIETALERGLITEVQAKMLVTFAERVSRGENTVQEFNSYVESNINPKAIIAEVPTRQWLHTAYELSQAGVKFNNRLTGETVKPEAVGVTEAVPVKGEVGAKELLDMLDGRTAAGTKHAANRDALIEQLRVKLKLPDNLKPAKLLNLIRKALRKSQRAVPLSSISKIVKRALDSAVEGKYEKVTKEELYAELEHREKAQVRQAVEKTIDNMLTQTKGLVDKAHKEGRKRGKKEAKDVAAEKKAYREIFKEVIKGTGLSKKVANRILAKYPEIKTPKALDKAINDAVEIVKKEAHKQEAKGLKKILSGRGKEARIDPVLDNVLTAIIRKLNPKLAETRELGEGKSIEEALDAYIEMRGAQVEPVAELIRELVNTEGGVDALTVKQVGFIGQFAKGLTRQHNAKMKAQAERKRLEDENFYADMNESVAAAWNLNKHDIKTDALGNIVEFAPWFKGIKGLVGTFTWGIEANARLTDAIEYISGSNNTLVHDILVKDVINGRNNASLALAQAHHVFYNTLKEVGLTSDVLADISDVNKKARKKNTIEVDGVGTITRAQLIEYLKQSKDLSTLDKFISGKNALDFFVEGPKGHTKTIEWSKEKHDALMAHVARSFAKEAKIADALIEIINHPSIKNELRAWGIDYLGYDIIQRGVYAPRTVRRVRQDKDVSKSEIEGLFDSIEELVGLQERSLQNVNMSRAKPRVEEHTRAIVIGDGVLATTRYLRAVTTLTNMQPSLARAIKLVRSPEFLAITSQKGPLGSMAGNLVENYYKPIVDHANAVIRNRSDLALWVHKARNNVVNTVLWGKLTIPAYQPLSEVAAASYLGKGGQRLMFRANKELGLWRWGRKNRKATLERMIGSDTTPANSGLAWERFQIANSYMLMAGEGIQTKHGVVTIAGKRHDTNGKKLSMITRSDQHAILRIYRASELKVEAMFKAKGIEVDYNSPLFKETVKRVFEDVVVETQPTYDPSMQPALLNRATDDPTVSAFTMFRGYTGKLTAMQRIAIVRAHRAYRRGNYREAEMHLRKMAEQTLIGSGFVAILRKIIKTGIRTGIAGVGFGSLSRPDSEEIEKYLTETYVDVLSQMVGMPIAGNLATGIVKSIVGMDAYDLSVSPLVDAVNTALRTIGAISKGQGGAMTYLAFAKSSGSVVGLPTIYIETFQDVIRAYEEKQKKEALELMHPLP